VQNSQIAGQLMAVVNLVQKANVETTAKIKNVLSLLLIHFANRECYELGEFMHETSETRFGIFMQKSEHKQKSVWVYCLFLSEINAVRTVLAD
jgi:hypothetical protein